MGKEVDITPQRLSGHTWIDIAKIKPLDLFKFDLGFVRVDEKCTDYSKSVA